ncbi:MAG: glycerol-3-phosphate acyltransferase [Planctomycetes bacterium]|nr:glycerol-3-phosphate acyltransferase [Planctomycetota bacterium]
MPPGRFFALCGASYVAGALVTAYYVVRAARGVDLRGLGSGTLGARNAASVLGRTGGALIALVDLAKGAAVVWIARALALPPLLACVAAACAVAGHVWPPQLGFKGGKGAAIAGGALIVLDPLVAICALVLLAAAAGLSRDTRLGGLAGFAAYPWIALAVRGASAAVLGSACLVALVLFAHRRDLRSGVRRKGVAP